MRFTLIVTTDPDRMAALGPRMQEFQSAFFAFNTEIEEKGIYVGGEPLDAVETAVTVRNDEGRITTTDGPFAETKEHVGGVYIVECPDRAAAVALAKRVPVVALGVGSVEMRPCCVFDRA